MRTTGLLITATVVCATLAGCGGADAPTDGTIALLLPDAKTARYETFDRPLFEARVAELGAYDVLYSNADGDATKQQQQAESALAAGADVLVLGAFDTQAAVSIVLAANAQGIPVISYDRLIAGGELAYYISFDNEKVGDLQATEFVAALAEQGPVGVLMVNGSPTDSNAAKVREGARRVIDASDLHVLAEYDTPGWSPEKAQEWVAGQIVQHEGEIAGVYAANDGVAGGAISALKAANVSPFPVVTGQDAELAAIQRIVAGDQRMTVYKAIRPQAERAAEIAVALIEGEEITAPLEIQGTPAMLLEPVPVTIDNIMETVVADGFWTVDDICTAALAAACDAAGLR